MNKLIIKLQKVATGRIVLLFIITMAVYLIILFYSIPAVISQAPEKAVVIPPAFFGLAM